MSLIKRKRPSPAMVISALALVFAMVGTAVAVPGAADKLTKSKVKTISRKQADKELKANIAGSHVNEADHATNADNANTANSANSANTADNANNSALLDGAQIAAGRIDGPTATLQGPAINLTNANIVRGPAFPTGVYCIGGLNPAPVVIVATHSNDIFNLNVAAEVGGDTDALCPVGFRQANIVVYSNAGPLSAEDVEIVLY